MESSCFGTDRETQTHQVWYAPLSSLFVQVLVLLIPFNPVNVTSSMLISPPKEKSTAPAFLPPAKIALTISIAATVHHVKQHRRAHHDRCASLSTSCQSTLIPKVVQWPVSRKQRNMEIVQNEMLCRKPSNDSQHPSLLFTIQVHRAKQSHRPDCPVIGTRVFLHLRLTVPKEMILMKKLYAESRKELLQYCCDLAWTKSDGIHTYFQMTRWLV